MWMEKIGQYQAWRQLNDMVQQAGNKGMISYEEQTDLMRRLKLAKSFVECNVENLMCQSLVHFEGELRNHIELSSTVIHQCANFALSDPSNLAYRSPCTHDHDEECIDCMQVKHKNVLLLQKAQQMIRTISLIRDQLNAEYDLLSELG